MKRLQESLDEFEEEPPFFNGTIEVDDDFELWSGAQDWSVEALERTMTKNIRISRLELRVFSYSSPAVINELLVTLMEHI